jgi:hypothetical protein
VRIEKVRVVASSKKTGASKDKIVETKEAQSKIEDAVLVEDGASSQALEADETDGGDLIAESAETVSSEEAQADDASPTQEPTEETPENTAADTTDEKPIAASAPHPEPEKKSVFLPLVLGGIIAGGAGYMASEYKVFGSAEGDIAADLRNTLSIQQERIDALEQIELPTVDLSSVEAQLVEIEDRIGALDTRIVAIEERPLVVVRRRPMRPTLPRSHKRPKRSERRLKPSLPVQKALRRRPQMRRGRPMVRPQSPRLCLPLMRASRFAMLLIPCKSLIWARLILL